MKKALSFAVALGLVAGVASVASAAELSINGDARWRGVYMDNAPTRDAAGKLSGFGADDRVANRQQFMDQRYRFNANLKINDDVTVNTRLVLRDGKFGNNVGHDTVAKKDIANGAANVQADRANIVLKTLGGTWTIGRQDVSWGNKFLAWGESADRIKGVYKAGDITYGGFLQQDREGYYNTLADNGDGDKTTYALLVIGKAGDLTWGVLPTYTINETPGTKADGKDTGYLIDPFFTLKLGPTAGMMGELVYQGGDLNENADGDAIWGGFVAAHVDVAPVTVKGLVAYWDGNQGMTGKRDCDNDFAPSVLIGTCNETAIIKFGETTSKADDTTMLIGAGVDFKASDKLTLGALVGYLAATDYGFNNDSASLVEIDATAQYALAQNAKYTFSIGYGLPDQFSSQDDAIVVVGNRIEVNW